ncbi:phage major capsid protein [Rhizorhabdus sp.]|uniref:phage major capsid protein n=1 Tax=Rhizorhabdus sp. TaxID=1968843 RepID=UPI0019BA6F10|nr:phage major capsid protein [Rhizorhabdus sp.]MBD3762459.1 phage major capsid protein [Rhizorhabdus sp.]
MSLAVLKNEARETAKRLEDRLNTAINDNCRDLTEEEEKAQAEDEATLKRQTAHIKRLEELSASSSLIGAQPAPPMQTTVTVPATPAAGGGIMSFSHNGIRYANARPRLDDGGFANMSEFAAAVRFANPAAGGAYKVDDRLAAPTNVHTETGDAAGSYLVPPEFRQQIIDLTFGGDDAMMNFIVPDPTNANRVVGIGDDSTPWGTSGIQAYWRVEAEQMTPSRMSLTPRETMLNEIYAFVLATEELLQDAPRVGTLLTVKAAAAIRWKLADAWMWGDGVAKPLGWMKSPALISVAKEGSQTADTVVRQNVAKMFARMINPTQASWLANGDIMPTLMELTNAANQPVWYPNYQVAPGGTLLGRPVLFTEHCMTVGDQGDLQFVNPNGYEAFRKQAMDFAESIHLYFDYNLRAFRWVLRAGGQPVLPAPVSPAHGANTKSHFVVLDERA